MIYKLGKLPAQEDKYGRTLKMFRYVDPDLMVPPAYAYEPNFKNGWGMMANDKYGCCAIAGPSHQEMTWGYYTGKNTVISDNDVLMSYGEVSGFNPMFPESDRGCNMLAVMNYWRSVGIGAARHKIDGFAKIQTDDLHMIKAGIFICEGLIIGLMLPKNIQGQSSWEYRPGIGSRAGSLGGHCVYLVSYDADYFTCVTWGGLLKISWRFMLEYCDEIFAPWSFEMFNQKGLAANGLNVEAMKRDLIKLAA